MANTIQATTGGGIIDKGGGILGECCCNECPNDYPPLAVTVSWTGSPPELTGGTYTWLGENFNNGDTKFICPTSYSCQSLGPVTNTLSTVFFDSVFCRIIQTYAYRKYLNQWKYGTGGTQDFLLENQYLNQRYIPCYGTHTNYVTCNPTSCFTGYGSVWDRTIDIRPLGGRRLYGRRIAFGGGTPATYTPIRNGISTDDITTSTFVLNPAPQAINSQQEGQLVTTSNVTISWKRAVLPDWCGT